jgi:hypothetical protein
MDRSLHIRDSGAMISINHRLAVPLKNPRAWVTSGAQTVYMSCQVHAKE